MNEIIKEKQKAVAPVGMQTQVSDKPIYEEEFEQTFQNPSVHEVTQQRQEVPEEEKHDRRQQLLTSTAYDNQVRTSPKKSQ
tara:strand:- start:303 stop:545 length:243 start_codon:yes stop_codon:yes gene_type:complete